MDWLKQATGLWDGDDTRNEAIKTEHMTNADGTISYNAGNYGWVSEEEYNQIEANKGFNLSPKTQFNLGGALNFVREATQEAVTTGKDWLTKAEELRHNTFGTIGPDDWETKVLDFTENAYNASPHGMIDNALFDLGTTIAGPTGGLVLGMLSPDGLSPSQLKVLQSMPAGGFKKATKTIKRVSTETGQLKGQNQMNIFREAILSGDEKAIAKALETQFANSLDRRFVDGRKGYYNIKRLVKDKDLLNNIVTKQDAIANAHFKLLKDPDNDRFRRELYELVGDTYFNKSPVVYGKSKFKDSITKATNWLTDTQWHHIFGNREAAEFMLSAVARDPLVGVNLAKLMDKLNLTSAGVADNLMLMKGLGHANLHELLRKLGIDPKYGRLGPLDMSDYSQAISDLATKGHKYGPKVFDPKTGASLAGKMIPPDPTYVNELFGIIEAYGKANKAIRKFITAGEAWYDPNLRRLVPKGTPGAVKYDFTLSKKGASKQPELMADKIKGLLKILEES